MKRSQNRLVINSMRSLSEAIQFMASMFREHKYLVLSWRTGRDRSLEQNGLWAGMYKRSAETTGQGTPDEVRAYCKLHFGVPIMCRDDEGFAAGWQRYFSLLPYEEQMHLMGPNPLFGPHGFPVTRLFSTRQGAEFTEALLDHFEPKGVYFDDMLERAA